MHAKRLILYTILLLSISLSSRLKPFYIHAYHRTSKPGGVGQ